MSIAVLSSRGGGEETARNALIEKLLNEIIIPEVDFTDATLEEAVDFLRRSSRDHDTKYKAGIGMIVSRREDGAGEKLRQLPPTPLVNLQLSNAPLSKVLRETLDAAEFDYRIGSNKIEIFPKPEQVKFPAKGQILKVDPKLATVDALAIKLGYEVRASQADHWQIAEAKAKND